MHRILILILLASGSLFAAEKVPAMVLSHIKAITRNEAAGIIKTVKDWPDQFAMVKKHLNKRVANKGDHQRLLGTIPKNFLKAYKIGSTIQSNGWILTSVDPANSEATESLWIMVIATHKNSDFVFTSSQW